MPTRKVWQIQDRNSRRWGDVLVRQQAKRQMVRLPRRLEELRQPISISLEGYSKIGWFQ